VLWAGYEGGGYGVGRNQSRVFNVPVGGVTVPEKCDAAFVGARGGCRDNMIAKLEGGIVL